MRRLLRVLTVGAMLAAMVATAVPAYAVPQNFGGSETSTQHRNNASGQGNFGQCHQIFKSTGGLESSQFNPSSQNNGAADCRQAGGLASAIAIQCQPGEDAQASGNLIFQPAPGESKRGSCT